MGFVRQIQIKREKNYLFQALLYSKSSSIVQLNHETEVATISDHIRQHFVLKVAIFPTFSCSWSGDKTSELFPALDLWFVVP